MPLEEKYKFRNNALNDHGENKKNISINNKSRKIFINQSLCPYQRKLSGLMKNLNNECLTDSFWISNGSVKIM